MTTASAHQARLTTALVLVAIPVLAAMAQPQQVALASAGPGDPPAGWFLASPPPDAVQIVVDGTTLYYADGLYCYPMGEGCRVIRPPLGAAVPRRPSRAVRLDLAHGTVWYDRGTFYRHDPVYATYVTVRAPVGAVVPDLPVREASIADVGGVLYYLYAGAFFRPTTRDGHTAYVVAAP